MTPTKTHPAVLQYRADAKYISRLTSAEARIIAASPAPLYRKKVAPIVALMAARHENNEYNAAKDGQDVDIVLHYTSAQAIKSCIARGGTK
jgi:hypothetical protein